MSGKSGIINRKVCGNLGFKFSCQLLKGFNFDDECFLCHQMLQDELAERSVQLEKVKRAGRDLVSTDESPSLKAVDILCAAGKFDHFHCRNKNSQTNTHQITLFSSFMFKQMHVYLEI